MKMSLSIEERPDAYKKLGFYMFVEELGKKNNNFSGLECRKGVRKKRINQTEARKSYNKRCSDNF